MNKCPICGHEVEAYHELPFAEPYVHNNPYDGLMIYGAYSSPKSTICLENNFFHFAFWDAEGKLTNHRLVQLNVENPTTASPSEDYLQETWTERDSWREERSETNNTMQAMPNDSDDLPF